MLLSTLILTVRKVIFNNFIYSAQSDFLYFYILYAICNLYIHISYIYLYTTKGIPKKIKKKLLNLQKSKHEKRLRPRQINNLPEPQLLFTMRHFLSVLYIPHRIAIVQFYRKTVGIIFLLPIVIFHHAQQILGGDTSEFILRMYGRQNFHVRILLQFCIIK